MINQKLKDALNEQIKHEMESSYIYLSMAAYFHSLSLDGMAHWMRCQTHEEVEHAMKFFDHIIDRGESVTLLDIKQLKTEWKNPLEAWKNALEHEEFISDKIRNLMKISREVMDFTSEPLLNWFIEEQIEEEANAGRNLERMNLLGENKQALLLLDRELGARPFPSGSPLNPLVYQGADG
jgi:ferritin